MWWWVVVVCKPILVFHFGPNRPGFKLLTLDLDQAEQLWNFAIPPNQFGEIFEGDSANMHGVKFTLTSMGWNTVSNVFTPMSKDPHLLVRKWFRFHLCYMLLVLGIMVLVWGITEIPSLNPIKIIFQLPSKLTFYKQMEADFKFLDKWKTTSTLRQIKDNFNFVG